MAGNWEVVELEEIPQSLGRMSSAELAEARRKRKLPVEVIA